jgi:nucleoside-diphosphate-sugar epimerase
LEQIEWICADITDVPSLEIAFQNINMVYHCAALISFDPKEEERLVKTNIEGTANIVNFCSQKNYVLSVLLLLWVIYRLMKIHH